VVKLSFGSCLPERCLKKIEERCICADCELPLSAYLGAGKHPERNSVGELVLRSIRKSCKIDFCKQEKVSDAKNM
jgi:hypothetical protein